MNNEEGSESEQPDTSDIEEIEALFSQIADENDIIMGLKNRKRF